jgi:hypothetical protein
MRESINAKLGLGEAPEMVYAWRGPVAENTKEG